MDSAPADRAVAVSTPFGTYFVEQGDALFYSNTKVECESNSRSYIRFACICVRPSACHSQQQTEFGGRSRQSWRHQLPFR
ncbi:hypothetical protein LSAT2_003750 [Lamellibrachia satsuma]|nr:hypothetical protein LSAT2_003750 [Lamellibrachia satsuma]